MLASNCTERDPGEVGRGLAPPEPYSTGGSPELRSGRGTKHGVDARERATGGLGGARLTRRSANRAHYGIVLVVSALVWSVVCSPLGLFLARVRARRSS
jgi:hypothetical protein